MHMEPKITMISLQYAAKSSVRGTNTEGRKRVYGGKDVVKQIGFESESERARELWIMREMNQQGRRDR